MGFLAGRTAAVMVLLVCALLCSGCYTTTYYNFQSNPSSDFAAHTGDEPEIPRYWRNFWVFGLAPGKLTIDAAADCGGVDHLERLETERTFVQGLINQFAGYYINVYSPYSARVVCDHSVLPEAS